VPDEGSAKTQNPTFYPPFIHQKQGGSSSDPLSHNRNLNHDLNPSSAPSRLGVDLPAGDEPQADDPALQGESIPVSPYETTRGWLERQGIKVPKIPKGARIISAG
jgi:hypothetical protein